MLLDVMVSLTILLLAAVGIFAGLDAATANDVLAQQQRSVVAAAQSLLDELRVSDSVPEGTKEGTFPGGQHWLLRISPLKFGDDDSGKHALTPEQVELLVTWQEGARTGTLTFRTLLLEKAP